MHLEKIVQQLKCVRAESRSWPGHVHLPPLCYQWGQRIWLKATAVTWNLSLACPPSGTIHWIPLGNHFQVLASRSAPPPPPLAKWHRHFTSLCTSRAEIPIFHRLHVNRTNKKGLKKEEIDYTPSRGLYWLLSPPSCLCEQPYVGCHTWIRGAACRSHGPSCHVAPLTAEPPACVKCLSYWVALHRGFLSFSFPGTWKSNALGKTGVDFSAE